jgi:DNA-dependent RNA polymerase
MVRYTGWQYLLIDAANHFGKDKDLFEDRIAFITNNLPDLEAMADQAETKPLYLKAVMAIRKAQQGIPTGHLVGLDATCSGIQVMSALTGCVAGAESTGLINPNVRADAYTRATLVMQDILGGQVNITRKQAKEALMTSFYGSKAKPKEIFGEKTPELSAFYQAATTIAPGAWELLQTLLASWQPYALAHSWKLPDGFDARVKVMQKKEARIEVDELDHATFTYEFYENEGSKSGLSNVANLTHSMDAWILRSMHRRCNYDRAMAEEAAHLIEMELIERSLESPKLSTATGRVQYYIEQYERSTLADIVILPHLGDGWVAALSTEHLHALAGILEGMLQYQPFELVTVHDEFKAHANNMDWVRWQYREILAEIADSDVLDDLLSQIHGVPGTFNKLSFNLGDQIRKSAYALC